MKLTQLEAGQSAQVKTFHHLSESVRKRLMVMGILPETSIRLVRRAPLGDPLQVEVRGVLLAVRETIASAIEVGDVE
ncbi:FeoA family protein [Vibrio quintilis]|uniref:Ferrous iron transport protein A n=1 Tax=Vibrio quintilis TaxID=1117707 RepID=A0A1M7YTE1_9VIBR|nr:FeoA family protein [Vibrio quintilis]SHO55904.1 Ferrous iron transport protein A [Vibrio quintilis]